MPGSGDRPPQSDEMRGDQLAPTLTSYQTTLAGEDEYLSKKDKRSLDNKFASLSEEEKQNLASHVKRSEEIQQDQTYAEAHMFNFFRSKGTKKGTLYTMQKNRLEARRVK